MTGNKKVSKTTRNMQVKIKKKTILTVFVVIKQNVLLLSLDVYHYVTKRSFDFVLLFTTITFM